MITEFKAYLRSVGYGKGSIDNMPRCVASFLSYHNITAPKEATSAHITGFYEWLHTRPKARGGGTLSESHIAHHIYALRVFFGWLEATGQLKHSPISALSFKRGEKKSREPLSREEVTALFEAAQTDRERAVLHLLYSCGLRRSECAALDITDLHYRARMLYVRRGKGRKRRAIPITEKVADALECYYLAERSTAVMRPGQGNPGYRHPTAFLLNKVGGRMSGATCNDLIASLKKRAGLERPVTPHYLRHSIATHLLEAGVPIEQVKDFLGHSTLEATQLYAKVYSRQLRNL